MKVLKAGIDFSKASEINPQLGTEFLIKSSIATGWAKRAKVVRLTGKQVEVEVVNIIPTEETNRFGTKNGLKDRHEGFLLIGLSEKKAFVGEKMKFFKESCERVGDSGNWNPAILCEILN